MTYLAFAFALMVGAAPVSDVPAEPEPQPEPVYRVWLGVDCTKPFMVSLPDDVLTECEAAP